MIEIIEKQVNDSDYTAMDIAAAFLKQALGQVNLENDRENGEIDWDNTGAEEGMVRLFINIGKKDRVKPGDILVPSLESQECLENSSVRSICTTNTLLWKCRESMAKKY